MGEGVGKVRALNQKFTLARRTDCNLERPRNGPQVGARAMMIMKLILFMAIWRVHEDGLELLTGLVWGQGRDFNQFDAAAAADWLRFSRFPDYFRNGALCAPSKNRCTSPLNIVLRLCHRGLK